MQFIDLTAWTKNHLFYLKVDFSRYFPSKKSEGDGKTAN